MSQGIAEIVITLARSTERAIRNAAGGELLRAVQRMCRQVHSSLGEADRDDIASSVTERVLEAVKAGEALDKYHEAYVRAMVKNRGTDHVRRAARERAAAKLLEGEAKAEGAPEPQLSPGAALEALEQRLAPLVARALADRQERYRAGLQDGIREVMELATGVTTMEAACRKEGVEGSRGVNRLQKRHQRAREALAAALDASLADGSVGQEEYHLLKLVLARLLRCQRARASGVEGPAPEA